MIGPMIPEVSGRECRGFSRIRYIYSQFNGYLILVFYSLSIKSSVEKLVSNKNSYIIDQKNTIKAYEKNIEQ